MPIPKTDISAFWIFLISLFLFGCGKEAGDDPDMPLCDLSEELQMIADEISEKYAHPLEGANPTLPSEDINPLITYLSDAHFVGLGEATHGTSEFYSTKDRIFRALVDQKHFEAIIFEIPWGNAQVVNDYVVSGTGTLDDVVNQTYYWVYDTGEVRYLVEWIRQRNAVSQDTVRFVGCDPQGGDFEIEKKMVKDFVEKVAPDSLTQILLHYSNLPGNASLPEYHQSPVGIHDKNIKGTDEVFRFLERHQTEFTAETSEYDFQVALMTAHLIQHREYMYRIRNFGSTRDSLMAVYTEWWQSILSEDAHVAIWAHNFHVMDGQSFGAPWMGSYLRSRHGSDYKNVAFSFGSGFFNAFLANSLGNFAGSVRIQYLDEPVCHSTNHLLSEVEGNQHYIIFDELQGESSQYFKEAHKFVQMGAGFNKSYVHNYTQQFALSDLFDVLIHFDETAASDLQ